MYLTLSLHPDPFTKLETVFDELGRGFTPFYHLDVNSKVDQLTLIGQDTALRVAITSGTFTAGSSTVTFSATDTGNTIQGTLSGSTGKFYNVIFGVSGSPEWTPNAAVEITNDLTMTGKWLVLSTQTSCLG